MDGVDDDDADDSPDDDIMDSGETDCGGGRGDDDENGGGDGDDDAMCEMSGADEVTIDLCAVAGLRCGGVVFAFGQTARCLSSLITITLAPQS